MGLDLVTVYSDGSYTSTNAVWGFICYDLENKEIFRDRGMLRGKINEMHQIGGEIYGVTEAIRYCKKNNFKADIVVDYKGLVMWIADILEISKPWKCRNQYTAEYREFIIENKIYINQMRLVRGHSNCAGNNAVDAYCKALWCKPKTVETK